MYAWNVTRGQLEQALKTVNEQYDGNVCWNRSPELRGKSQMFTIRVQTGHGKGAKRAASGRRTASACWHVHRDFMVALFDLAPNTRLKTALADYRGRDDFNAKFEGTGNRNAGSAMEPQELRTACDCAA